MRDLQNFQRYIDDILKNMKYDEKEKSNEIELIQNFSNALKKIEKSFAQEELARQEELRKQTATKLERARHSSTQREILNTPASLRDNILSPLNTPQSPGQFLTPQRNFSQTSGRNGSLLPTYVSPFNVASSLGSRFYDFITPRRQTPPTQTQTPSTKRLTFSPQRQMFSSQRRTFSPPGRVSVRRTSPSFQKQARAQQPPWLKKYETPQGVSIDNIEPFLKNAERQLEDSSNQ